MTDSGRLAAPKPPIQQAPAPWGAGGLLKRLVPVLIYAAWASTSEAQQARYRIGPGDTLRYRESTESTVGYVSPRIPSPVKTTHNAVIAIAAERGDTVTAWYERLVLSSTTPQGKEWRNTAGALNLPFRLVMRSRHHVIPISAPSLAEVDRDLYHQFEDFFISLPAAAFRIDARWADTVENDVPAGPGDTYHARHVRQYRVLRDTTAAGGLAAKVIMVQQEMSVRVTHPLGARPDTLVTFLQGSEEGTAVFAAGPGQLLSRVRRGQLRGHVTLESRAKPVVVPMTYEYTSSLRLVR